jgi:uncharacterized membrane protein YfcA
MSSATPLLTVLGGAGLIGALLGLLGGGGTILTVPLVQAVLGLDTRHAVALSLPVVAAAAATGALLHWRAGRLDPVRALGIALAASLGAFVGARIGRALPSSTQALLLSSTLVVAAIVMWRRRAATADATARPRHTAALLATGVGVGTLTGLVGVGGGFLVVPALVALGGFTAAEAVRTSLVVITFSATTAAVGYRGVAVPWDTAAVMALAASFGVAGCTFAGLKLPARLVNSLFPIGLLLAAVFIARAR